MNFHLTCCLGLSWLIATQPVLADTAMLHELDTLGRSLAKRPCAKPVKTTELRITNPYDAMIISKMVNVRCIGIVSETYRDPSIVLPVKLELKVAHTGLPAAVQVGATRQSVLQALGKPATTGRSTDTYPLSDERPDQDSVSFIYTAGRVSSVVWVWEIDWNSPGGTAALLQCSRAPHIRTRPAPARRPNHRPSRCCRAGPAP